MTISVPPDVRHEMGSLGVDVNWSLVATEAFRAKVLEVQQTRKGDSVQTLIKVDDSLLRGALSAPSSDGPGDIGYINRLTGRIVFLTRTFQQAESHWGRQAAQDMVRDRATVEKQPDNWIEVPRWQGTSSDQDGQEQHMVDFMNEHGFGG